MNERYITNDLGDIAYVESEGVRRTIDPSEWGWVNKGGRKDRAESRWSIDTLRALPGFTVEELPGEKIVPGPRRRGATWGNFVDGAAPPAAVESRDGKPGGTLGYWDRLSEAVGQVGILLPARPDRSPMVISDFVAGRRFRISYMKPVATPTGTGTVYVLEDGFAIKVGFTYGAVAKRIGELQTGNPRRITVIAEIGAATLDAELALHQALNEWNVSGEWFDRGALIAHATAAGGFGPWLSELLGPDWQVVVHPPYR